MKVLMVCLGNICRSPLAEGILQQKVKEKNLNWTIDSCGTSGWHQGELPDRRSIEVAISHGIDITHQRSRQLIPKDLVEFDLILAMDSSNYNNILKIADSDTQKKKVKLLLNYLHPGENRGVPDPYYEGGFRKVFNMISDACDKVLEQHMG